MGERELAEKKEYWFVILSVSDGSPVPMTHECDGLATFKTEREAEDAAKLNPLGRHYGFRVYEF